jgi:putative oxidoreductase
MTSADDLGNHVHHDHRPLIDRIAADFGNAIWLIGRILIAAIFVQSGFGKLSDLAGTAAYLGSLGVPAASVVAPISGIAEFAGGLAIVLGIGTRYAALILIAFTIGATLLAHRFWAVPPAEAQNQMIHFSKNVAIIGGFLFVFVTGGGRFSLDRWLRHHHG